MHGPRRFGGPPVTNIRNVKSPHWRQILCARSGDPLIAHEFEAKSLALIQAGHSCAFDGAYVDQHVNTTVVGLDETIALRDVEPPYGSNCHSRPPAHQGHFPAGRLARMTVDHLQCGARPSHRRSSPANPLLKTASPAEV